MFRNHVLHANQSSILRIRVIDQALSKIYREEAGSAKVAGERNGRPEFDLPFRAWEQKWLASTNRVIPLLASSA